ncbi:MAG: hypothetical protein QXN36_07065 [Candidatus Bathyarchaeia archaeon]
MQNIKLVESKTLKFSVIFCAVILILSAFSLDISLVLNFSEDESSILRKAEYSPYGRNKYFAIALGIDVTWLNLVFIFALASLILGGMLFLNRFLVEVDEAYLEREAKVIRNIARFFGIISMLGVILFIAEILKFNMHASNVPTQLSVSPDIGWYTCLIASILFFVVAKKTPVKRAKSTESLTLNKDKKLEEK